MSSYICGGSSFHPYECSHDNHCIHCTWGETEYHNPRECAFCMDMTEKYVDDIYHKPIKVWDMSHRKRKIDVKKEQQLRMGVV